MDCLFDENCNMMSLLLPFLHYEVQAISCVLCNLYYALCIIDAKTLLEYGNDALIEFSLFE
uniref:Uncharacterized protein n=1 Tax=Anguilla anguilla TaxID=7936 RepID=A0A0E9QXM5_ANGAN